MIYVKKIYTLTVLIWKFYKMKNNEILNNKKIIILIELKVIILVKKDYW